MTLDLGKEKSRRHFIAGAFLVALLLALFGKPVLTWLSRKMLFPAPPVPRVSAARERSDVTVVELSSGTEAWLLTPFAARSARVAVLVFTHGNAELIDHWLEDFQVPLAWGVAVLLVEYPGYGRSKGAPSQRSITQTMIEAHDYLTGRADIDAGRIIAYGRSLGGGAAAVLAQNRSVAALILESTFSSVRDRAKELGFPAFVVADPFDVLEAVKAFPGPILGIHGKDDRIVPHEHARRLKAAGKNFQLVTLPCGHNDCPRPWLQIHAFLKEHDLLPAR